MSPQRPGCRGCSPPCAAQRTRSSGFSPDLRSEQRSGRAEQSWAAPAGLQLFLVLRAWTGLESRRNGLEWLQTSFPAAGAAGSVGTLCWGRVGSAGAAKHREVLYFSLFSPRKRLRSGSRGSRVSCRAGLGCHLARCRWGLTTWFTWR